MTALELIRTLHEKKRPAPNWTDTDGVYGDYKNYPAIEFYCKCPKCGQVHGDYKNMREAHGKRLCDQCNVEAINKAKKLVKEVDAPKNRGKPFKGLSRVFNEADTRLPAPGEAAPDDFDAREYLLATPHYGGWLDATIKDLSEQTKIDLRLKEDQRSGFDEEYPDEAISVELEGEIFEYGRHHECEFKVWKSEDEAETEAHHIVVEMLTDEPGNFTQDWLQHFIPMDRLKEYYSESAIDVEWLTSQDFQEQVDYLINHGHFLDEDDFYTPTGKFRKITKRTQALFDAGLEAFQEKQKADFDPIEWLEGIYGKEEARAEAIKAVGLDVEAAAQSAIASDGWDHFMFGYQDGHWDLAGGAVAIRTQ